MGAGFTLANFVCVCVCVCVCCVGHGEPASTLVLW
jgi:hypothetical protein